MKDCDKKNIIEFLTEIQDIITNALRASANNNISYEVHHIGLTASLEDISLEIEKKVIEINKES